MAAQNDQNLQHTKVMLGTAVFGVASTMFSVMFGASGEMALKVGGFGALGAFLLLTTFYILHNYTKCGEQCGEDQAQVRAGSVPSSPQLKPH